VAKNPGVVKAFEKSLDIEMQLPEEPQITGALGAALFADSSWQVVVRHKK